MNDIMKKGIIYSRVSSGKQDFENQLIQLNDYAKSNKIEIIKEFGEVVSGAVSGEDRDEFALMIEYIDKYSDKIDFLLVYELSRIGRKISDVHSFIEKCNSLGICVFVKKDNIKTLNDDLTINNNTRILLSVLIMVAEIEREQIRSRSIDAKNQKIFNTGIWQGGKPPFGYAIDENKMLVPHPENANILLEIFKMYDNGNSSVVISNWLMNNKILTVQGNKKWYEGTVRQLLANDFFNGKRKYKGVEVGSPKLIPDELFKRVNYKLHRNPNLLKRSKYNYVLPSKVFKCGMCDDEQYIYVNTPSVQTLKCSTYRYDYHGKKCENFGVGIKKMYNALFHLLDKNGSFDDNNVFFKEKVKLKEKVEVLINTKDTYLRELKKVKNKLANIKELFIDGDYTKVEYLNKKETVANREFLLMEKIQSIDREVEDINNIDYDLSYSLDGGNIQRIRLAMNELIEAVYVYPIKQELKFSKRKSDVYSAIIYKLKHMPFYSGGIVSRFTNVLSQDFDSLNESETAKKVRNKIPVFYFHLLDDSRDEIGDYSKFWCYDNQN